MTDHPIVRVLSPDQQALVEILGERWLAVRRWPVFDYVQRVLGRRAAADAAETMSQLPVIQGISPHNTYRLIFTERGGPYAEADQRVGLTVAGLFHMPGAEKVVDQLVGIIRFLADADDGLEPNPDQPVILDMPIQDLLSDHLRDELRGWSPETVAEALQHEPALWGSIQRDQGRIQLRAGLLSPYRGVSDAQDYIRRVTRVFGADVSRVLTPTSSSPLTLPEALGYLDAVWQNRFGSHLLGRVQPGSIARLALGCESTDELNARLSALADVLGHFEIKLSADADREAKKAGDRSLVRMRKALAAHLEGEAFVRADDAVRSLQRIVRIRVGGQHSGLGADTAEAFRDLGLAYPPSDPGAAWDGIRSATTVALNAIRQEIQAESEPKLLQRRRSRKQP